MNRLVHCFMRRAQHSTYTPRAGEDLPYYRSCQYTVDLTYLLRGFSPLANYTDRAIAAGQRN
jgi:hypothetical protein